MYIKACQQILVHYSKRFFKENILDTILSIEDDPVLSVCLYNKKKFNFIYIFFVVE